MILRYIWRELIFYRQYSLLFILNISVGLVGLAALESFKTSIETQVTRTSQEVAGGDIFLRSRLVLNAQDIGKVYAAAESLGATLREAELIEMFAMVYANKQSRLVQLRAQDAQLPFYGAIQFDGGDVKDQTSKREISKGAVWIYPELLVQLGVKLGDKLEVGGREFTVEKVVKKDSGVPLGFGAMAPRAYIHVEDFRSLELLQKGSLVSYQRVFKVEPSQLMEPVLKEAEKKITDPAVEIRSHTNSSEANVRMLTYLNDYLGLVVFVAMLLSNVGILYLFRAHLIDRLKDIAILQMLGAGGLLTFSIYFVQTLLFSSIGCAMSLLLTHLLLPLISQFSQQALNYPIALGLTTRAAFAVWVVGVGSVVFCLLPFLTKTTKVSPKLLLDEAGAQSWTWTTILAWVPFFVFSIGTAFWLTKSIYTTAIFFVAIVAVFVVFAILGWLLLSLGKSFFLRLSFARMYALRELVRRPLESLLVFMALAFATLLPLAIVFIEKEIKQEFTFGPEGERPELFLIDIQDEQLPDVKEMIVANNIVLQNASPLIRARLLKVNNKAFERHEQALELTREDEQRQRQRNRGFNLSERGHLSRSEKVTEGRYFSKAYDPSKQELPEISLEKRFAQRMGLRVGDQLIFDVMGVEVAGVVVGLRSVRWASFQPNFFIQFQEGVFKDTPKTFVASVPTMDFATKAQLQQQLVQHFPNISILDVSQTTQSLLALASHMAMALKTTAFLVVLVALIVAWSIQRFHLLRHRQERNWLWLLGAQRAVIARIERIEVLTVVVLAVVLGSGLSWFFAQILYFNVFQG